MEFSALRFIILFNKIQRHVNLDKFKVSDAIKACIREMAYPKIAEGTDPISSIITVSDFLSGFKTISEKPLSSPSGWHFLGHYCAALKSVPFEFGFTLLDPWTNATKVMLENLKGHPCIDKLWVIQLLEVDLNMVLCIVFGCCLIHCAGDKRTISPAIPALAIVLPFRYL